MKRKLFIGSSKEGLDIARHLDGILKKEFSDWLECETWDEGAMFSQNQSTLDALIKASRRYDYGILVATADDIVESKNAMNFAPRDNVILEMGMFLGSLGLTRAFLLVEEDIKLPSDYHGITVPFFQKSTADSLDRAIGKIVKQIADTQNTFNLKPMPSAALALGYFENLIQPIARKKLADNANFKFEILLPKRIKDIRSEITAFKNENPSTERSMINPDSRPTAFEYNDSPNYYWDMPTTLGTLSSLMNLLLPPTEVGISKEKQHWIDYELRNFASTLGMLIEDCPACRGKVVVTHL